MTDFNLRDLVKSVLASSSEADPNVVAREVLAKIKRADYRAALEQSLGQYVRVVSNGERNAAYPPRGFVPSPVASGRPVAKNVSSFRSGVSEGWRRALAVREPIEGGGWKVVRDLTSADLLYAAQMRDQKADQNAAKARFYREVDRRLDEHGVKTVGELPDNVLAELFGGAS